MVHRRTVAMASAMSLGLFMVTPLWAAPTWNNTGSGDWFTAGNWTSPSSVPTSADNAVIDNGGTAVIATHDAVANAVYFGNSGVSGAGGSLQIDSGSLSVTLLEPGFKANTYGVVTQTGGSVNLVGGAANRFYIGASGTGTYNLSGGSVTTNGGEFTFGRFAGGSGTFNQSGGTVTTGGINVTSGLYQISGGTLTDSGTFNLRSSAATLRIVGSAASISVATLRNDTNDATVDFVLDNSANHISTLQAAPASDASATSNSTSTAASSSATPTPTPSSTPPATTATTSTPSPPNSGPSLPSARTSTPPSITPTRKPRSTC